ncbi:Transcription factor as1 [Irineochytrium annulatum]|nr:Transcription factor as1 [Irineochytrium annulatum]
MAYDSGRLTRLIAARDRMGVKPLFLATYADGSISLASEMKAFNFNQPPTIREIPPGAFLWLTVRRDEGSWAVQTRFHRFHNLRRLLSPPASEQALDPTLTAVRASLIDAVRKRMESDTPVAVLLSGGLDSALVAALASQTHRGLTTFHACVAGTASADRLAARRVAAHIGSAHVEVELEAHAACTGTALAEVIWHSECWDPPVVRAGLAMMLLCREVRQRGFRVVLCGEGADELFGGYALFGRYGRVEEFRDELARRLVGIEGCELLRVDRCGMAAGVECRVPFMDLAVVGSAIAVPAEAKMHMGARMEKWALREAFKGEDLLPEEVLWRRKEQFAEGLGGWVEQLSVRAAESGLDEAGLYRAIFKTVFADRAPAIEGVVLERSRRRKCIGPGHPVTADVARTFLTRVLGLKIGLLTCEPTLATLNEVVGRMLDRIPFHNLTLLTRPRRPPTLSEIRDDMTSGLGGPCSVINTFLAFMLERIGYEVSLLACHISGRAGCHVGVLVTIDGSGSGKWFVDAGNGKPYRCASDVGHATATTLEHEEAFGFCWRVAPVDKENWSVQHRRRGTRNKWEDALTFNPGQAVLFETFTPSIIRSRTEPGYNPFLFGLRITRYGGQGGRVIVRDRMWKVGAESGEFRDEGEVAGFVGLHFGDIEGFKDLTQKALRNLKLF